MSPIGPNCHEICDKCFEALGPCEEVTIGRLGESEVKCDLCGEMYKNREGHHVDLSPDFMADFAIACGHQPKRVFSPEEHGLFEVDDSPEGRARTLEALMSIKPHKVPFDPPGGLPEGVAHPHQETHVSEEDEKKTEAQKKLRYYTATFPLGDYQHYKGPTYCVFAVSLHEETLEVLVHYYSYDHGTRWTRTLENFVEKVAHSNENTGGDLYDIPRFKFISQATNRDILAADYARAPREDG